MSEELNNALLHSQLHNSSTDQLHQSLRLLVRKIRAQLEVLTKKNKLKEEENVSLKTEISTFTKEISNLQTIINTKTSSQNTLNDQIKEYKLSIDAQLKRHNAIKSQLLSQISQLKKDKNHTIQQHQQEIKQINAAHTNQFKQEQQNFDNLRNQKLSSDKKLQQIMTNNDELYRKLQNLQEKQETLSSMTNIEKNELEKKMEGIKRENINYLSNMQQLKNEINSKDKEINEIGTSLLSMQNDINHLQTESQSNNENISQYQEKLKQSEKENIYYKNQYQQLQNTMDKIIDASKQMDDDEPFWSIECENEDENEMLHSTVAHPYPSTPTSISVDMDHHKRLLELQMFPKRISKLQNELKDVNHKLNTEKDNNAQVIVYWKNKTKEISTKNTDLCKRMENLEGMADALVLTNDNLLKHNDSLKAELHSNKFTASAHEIFLQMKTKEETQKTIELQQELDVLQDDLCRKNALISKFEKSNRITKESMAQQKKLHHTEMLQLTNKLHLLTELSQEEIQQTFHLTIQELQSILDQNTTTIEMDDTDMNEENKIDLSPKVKPHITDSDVGDIDDADIIEAEDKLASYFARHKQRQLAINHSISNRNNSVEPIEEVNEDVDDDKNINVVPQTIKPQIVQIVDDDAEDENILTPPLQEEAPYIVDDTLSMAISNVSVSNVANSNCSTRGNSTRGDQSPASKIDEPPKINESKGKPIEEKENNATEIIHGQDTEQLQNLLETKTQDIEIAVEEFVSEEKSDSGGILHSLQTFLANQTSQSLIPQPLQHRTRSLGSINTGDDTMSVDQSMLAHDGSRDGSVVPEQVLEIFPDDNDGEIINADESQTFTLAVQSQYVATPEVADTEITDIKTIHSGDVSVDDLHHEAHQIIDQVHHNLKELEAETVPGTSMENEITNNDILGPLVQRQEQQEHGHDLEERKKLLRNAKAKWSVKVEEMIANTDSWFINEDGDIVLIYPEPDNVQQKHDMDDGDKNDPITKMIVDNMNMQQQKSENKHENVSGDLAADRNEIDDKKKQNRQVCDDEKNLNNESNVNEENANNIDQTNENFKKTENFFNSFRIF